MTRRFMAATFGLSAGFFFLEPLSAATFQVNTDADTVDATPGDGGCADASGDCSLRAAVMETNALAGPDRIEIPAGHYRLLLVGAGEDAAATGDLDITGRLTLEGAGRDDTIIDGLGADRVFHALGTQDLTVSELALTNGNPAGALGGGIFHQGPQDLSVTNVRFEDCSAGAGGGIAHLAGDLTVELCVFDMLVAPGGGGGIHKTGAGPLHCSDTQFTEATAGGGGPGGGIFFSSPSELLVENCGFLDCAGGIGGGLFGSTAVDAAVLDCEFESCDANGGGAGGGAYISAGGEIQVAGCSFTDCFSGSAGGCYLSCALGITLTSCQFVDNLCATTAGGAYCSTGGPVEMQGDSFVGNQAISGNAGGAYVSTAGELSMDDTIFSENDAGSVGGGGAYVSVGDACTYESCRFLNNTAQSGGGGGLYHSSAVNVTMNRIEFSGNRISNSGGGGGMYISIGGELLLNDATIAGNLASGPAATGGGIYFAAAMPAEATNCTFSANTSGGLGGAVFASQAIHLTHCTFAENAALAPATPGSAIYNFAAATSLQNTIIANSIAGDNCSGVAIVSNGHNIDDDGTCAAGADDSSDDPELGPLQDNGGPTPTHALSATSPALEAASTGACPDADQRGVERPQDGDNDGDADCDIGAFEFFDCNENGTDDTAEIAAGAADCNDNGVPDDCESEDTDADGVADQCDECTDTDGDGFGDPGFAGNTCAEDNCPTVANPDQADGNGNGIGDACEGPAGQACCGGASPLALPFMLGGWMMIRRRSNSY